MLALLIAPVLVANVVTAAPARDFGVNNRFGPTACRAGVTDAAAPSEGLLRPQDRKAVKLKRLGDLPKANKEIAVFRTVAGCEIPLVVSYEVEQDGHFAGR